jgi:uncharacterized protein
MADLDLTRSDSRDLVPLGRLRRSRREPVDAAAIEAAGRHLEEFAQGLTLTERATLYALLRSPESPRPEQQEPPLPAAVRLLAAQPAAAVLAPDEAAVVERLAAAPAPAGEGLRRNLVLIMKATRRCNLRCTYCHFWSDEPNQRMSFEVLARTTRGALAAPGVQSVEFVWHGGETTLLPTSFYRKAVWLQRRFARPGQTVRNSIQTNATHLTAEWLEFLRAFRFDVGVSLDGPPEVNDLRRVDVAGRPTSARVHQGLARLRQHGIPHGVLMVVDETVAALGGRRILDYFLQAGVSAVALLNVLPENTAAGTPIAGTYIAWSRFVEFLRELFAAWWPEHAERITFRELTDLMAKVQGGPGKMCVFAGNCMGGFLTIEPTGEVGSCDKFRGDLDYRFGSVMASDLADLPAAPRFARTHAHTEAGVQGTAGCRWFEVCKGGCPHDRYVRQQHDLDHDESCCGLAPLLDDMAAALGGPRAGREDFQPLGT